MACETSDEFEAIAEAAGDEQISALTETELAALEAHYADIYVGVIPETVVFTDAGPFMPAVNVSSTARFRMMRAPAAEEPADNGLALSKTATTNADGTYTITMEAYTTGEVITSTKTVPVDIVLVLDQSGSMAYDFNGNSTSTNSARRQYAMKQAVNNFIDKVNEKYSAEADHRMAIVTFGSDADTLQGWTFVDEAGKTALQSQINKLPNSPEGATNVAAGMTQAETLMGSGYNYKGTNTQRQKVVIVFTDGVPTTSTNFNTTVATNAISSAKNLKDAGATVYTVGIFNSADPTQLYGDKFDRAWPASDNPCNGNVGEYWGYTNVNAWTGGGEDAIRGLDIAATNRFLNFLSSNFAVATEIGIEEYSSGLLGGDAWRITKNFTRTASNYYLTANDSTSLNTIFQTISENIQSANINLGSETVVKDALSPYFDLPANASDIKLYTAAAKADGTFEDRVAAPSAVKATVDGDTVSVTGFNFNDNFVSDKAKSDGTYGKKLIIEFNVTPKDEFLGGNDVPTNDWENTAVYDKDGNEVEKFADANTTPTVDVPIKAVTVTAADKNVYLLDDLTKDQLISGSTVKAGNVTLDLTADNYGLEAWQNAYVNISIDPKDADGTTVSGLNDLKDDTTYSVSVTVSPMYEGTAEAAAGTASAKVNVFMPEITFQDSAINLGETPNYATQNFVSVVWKHNNVVADTSAMGQPPELTYKYDREAAAFGEDTPVVVTEVLLNNVDVRNHADFKFGVCDYNNCDSHGDWKFVVHIKTFDLTIIKSITRNESKLYGSQDFVFNVKCEDKNIDIDVVVNVPDEGTRGSVTIKGLPVGTYTITENTGWSWRYNLQGAAAPADATGTVVYETGSSSATYTPRGTNNQIIFTNNWVQAKWLSFTDSVKNIFGKPNT